MQGDDRGLHRWPSKGPDTPQALPMSESDVNIARQKIHAEAWHAITVRDWGAWERSFWKLRERAIPYDEATYCLLIHGHVLSHRHTMEAAYSVLEEMRHAGFHPTLVRMNQRLLDTAYELRALKLRPLPALWQNMVRVAWHSSIRFQKKRQVRLRDELQALPPNEALALEPSHVRRWIQRHDHVEAPALKGGVARFLPLDEEQSLLPEHRGSNKKQLLLESRRPSVGRKSRRKRGARR